MLFRLVIVDVDTVNCVIVPEAEVKSAMLALLIVVVASVEVPVTTKVFVVVELVTVKSSINPVSAWKKLAKRLDEVALVVEAYKAKKLVVDEFVLLLFIDPKLTKLPLVAEKLTVKKLVELLLVDDELIVVKLVIVA